MSASNIEDERHELLYSMPTACTLLGIKRTMLFSLIASKQIRSVKVGRLRKIARADLEAYVERLRAERTDEEWRGDKARTRGGSE